MCMSGFIRQQGNILLKTKAKSFDFCSLLEKETAHGNGFQKYQNERCGAILNEKLRDLTRMEKWQWRCCRIHKQGSKTNWGIPWRNESLKTSKQVGGVMERVSFFSVSQAVKWISWSAGGPLHQNLLFIELFEGKVSSERDGDIAKWLHMLTEKKRRSRGVRLSCLFLSAAFQHQRKFSSGITAA